MSVLIYPNTEAAAKAAAAIFVGTALENPYATIGVTYDSVLDETFRYVRQAVTDGVLSFANHRFYQLCEFVPGDENGPSLRSMLQETLLKEAQPEQYVVPYDKNRNWAEICAGFEQDILDHGGLDFTILVLRPDGSLLYNLAGDELAPITHVEMIGGEKVVSAGMATIMRSKKLIVFAAGTDAAETVSKALGGSVNDRQPASYLQLHQNVTFILDERAASLL